MINSVKQNNSDFNSKKTNISHRNLGIEILRAFLCFRIVLLHYYSSNDKYILSLKKSRFQVASFFFISFYFLFPIISQRNSKKLKLRLERILIPYVIHPIINWIINNIMFLLIKFNRYNRFLTLLDLKTQLIVGRGIYGIAVLWFQFNLIFFTIFFFIIAFIIQEYYLSLFQIIAIISYKYQYLGINNNFFKQYTENIWMSVGNLLETFPIAICAFSLASINFHKTLSKNQKKSLLISFLFIYLISNYDIFTIIIGFSSPGIKCIFYSVVLFSFFFVLPCEILNKNLLIIIKQITKYTQGIYCLHFLFQYYMRLKFEKTGSFFGCVILYFISYLTSFIGFKIFFKTKLKYLFA